MRGYVKIQSCQCKMWEVHDRDQSRESLIYFTQCRISVHCRLCGRLQCARKKAYEIWQQVFGPYSVSCSWWHVHSNGTQREGGLRLWHGVGSYSRQQGSGCRSRCSSRSTTGSSGWRGRRCRGCPRGRRRGGLRATPIDRRAARVVYKQCLDVRVGPRVLAQLVLPV